MNLRKSKQGSVRDLKLCILLTGSFILFYFVCLILFVCFCFVYFLLSLIFFFSAHLFYAKRLICLSWLICRASGFKSVPPKTAI